MYLGEITRNILLSLLDAAPKSLLLSGQASDALNRHYGVDTAVMSAIEEAWEHGRGEPRLGEKVVEGGHAITTVSSREYPRVNGNLRKPSRIVPWSLKAERCCLFQLISPRWRSFHQKIDLVWKGFAQSLSRAYRSMRSLLPFKTLLSFVGQLPLLRTGLLSSVHVRSPLSSCRRSAQSLEEALFLRTRRSPLVLMAG